jgi:hypothetical protein
MQLPRRHSGSPGCFVAPLVFQHRRGFLLPLSDVVEYIIFIQHVRGKLNLYNYFKKAGKMTPTTGHGGKREGAGRKPINPEGPTINIGATVPESLMERLDALAERRGWNRSEAVTEAIRGLLASAGRQKRR